MLAADLWNCLKIAIDSNRCVSVVVIVGMSLCVFVYVKASVCQKRSCAKRLHLFISFI